MWEGFSNKQNISYLMSFVIFIDNNNVFYLTCMYGMYVASASLEYYICFSDIFLSSAILTLNSISQC